MSVVTAILDHADRALQRLPAVLRAPLEPLVSTVAGEVQELEEAALTLLDAREFRYASGLLLTQWGRLVGELRGDRTDRELRRFISARIAINGSQGDTPTLVRILALLADVADVRYWPAYPAGAVLAYFTDAPLGLTTHGEILVRLEQALPAGVSLMVDECTTLALLLDTEAPHSLDTGEMGRIIGVIE